MENIGEMKYVSVRGRAIEEVARAIQEGNAILFLGPGATINYDNPNRLRDFFKELATRDVEKGRIVAYHETDEFLVFNRNGRKILGPEIGKWFEQDFGNELSTLIAQIPFESIITISPDLAIEREFLKGGFPHELGHFSHSRTLSVPVATKSRPLIYKLFGDCRDPESLILSHIDAFKLVKAIQVDRRLPTHVLEALSQTEEQGKTIVFLGLDYYRWYFQFLLYFLHLRLGDWHFAIDGFVPAKDHQTYYQTEFKTLFIGMDPLGFLQELRNALPSNCLRKPSDGMALWDFVWIHLDDSDLELMCQLCFPQVHMNFTHSMNKMLKQKLLWDFVESSDSWSHLHIYLQRTIPGPYSKFVP